MVSNIDSHHYSEDEDDECNNSNSGRLSSHHIYNSSSRHSGGGISPSGSELSSASGGVDDEWRPPNHTLWRAPSIVGSEGVVHNNTVTPMESSQLGHVEKKTDSSALQGEAVQV